MRIAIMGTGGVGGYFGGLLAKAGEDVTFIARGAHLRALQTGGLRVESVHGDFTVSPVKATDDPSTVGPVDYVLLTTKTYQVDAALEAMRPMVGQDTAVLPLENGVDAPERIVAAFGPQAALGGVCYVSAFIAEPGAIRQESQFRRVVVGELDGRVTPRVEALAAAINRSGALGEVSPDIQKVLWTKFVFIAPFSGVGAVSRAPIGDLLACAETRQLLEDAMREVETVGRAAGVQLDATVVNDTMAFVGKMDAGIMASMQRDMLNGKPSELDAIVGYVVRKGAELGVPAPAFRFMYAALLPQERRARQ